MAHKAKDNKDHVALKIKKRVLQVISDRAKNALLLAKIMVPCKKST